MKMCNVPYSMMGVCQRNEYSLNKFSVSGTWKWTPRWCACCLRRQNCVIRKVVRTWNKNFFGRRPSSWLSASRWTLSSMLILELPLSSRMGSTILTAAGGVEVGCTRALLRRYTMLKHCLKELCNYQHTQLWSKQTLHQAFAMTHPLPGYLSPPFALARG